MTVQAAAYGKVKNSEVIQCTFSPEFVQKLSQQLTIRLFFKQNMENSPHFPFVPEYFHSLLRMDPRKLLLLGDVLLNKPPITLYYPFQHLWGISKKTKVFKIKPWCDSATQ